MDDIRQTIAGNIASLRSACGMTQLELAEKLNYTDKAVSKWERAESMPDITVLKEIAGIFGVTVDYLLTADHTGAAESEESDRPESEEPSGNAAETEVRITKNVSRSKVSVTLLSILLVWLLATFTFVFFRLIAPDVSQSWLAFVYAVPVSGIVWLVMNSIWFRQKRNYVIISVLMWTILAAVHITFLSFGRDIMLIYVLGIPGQIILLVWSQMNTKKEK